MNKSQLKCETAWYLRIKRAERYGSRDNYTAGEIVDSIRYFCGLKI